MDNFVRYSEHHLNNGPFNNWTNVLACIREQSVIQIPTVSDLEYEYIGLNKGCIFTIDVESLCVHLLINFFLLM